MKGVLSGLSWFFRAKRPPLLQQPLQDFSLLPKTVVLTFYLRAAVYLGAATDSKG